MLSTVSKTCFHQFFMKEQNLDVFDENFSPPPNTLYSCGAYYRCFQMDNGKDPTQTTWKDIIGTNTVI